MNKIIIFILMIFAFSACTPKQENPENWTDEEVNIWFEKQEWLDGWNVRPDESINKKSLANYYFKNKKHWDQAFQFLKSSDLKNLPLGRQDLEGDHLYISVDEYTTKDKRDTRFESHRKYADIQYVIKGEELMGLTTLDKVEVADPYNEENDIVFYSFEGGDYIKATPENFVIFFPEDAHRPMMKVGEDSIVKKIVVKVMIE